jgi:hypothetical protein
MCTFWSPLVFTPRVFHPQQKIIVMLRTDTPAKLYDIKVSFKSLIWSDWLRSPKRGGRIDHFVVYPQYMYWHILTFPIYFFTPTVSYQR